jgi:hypothetical protein
LALATNPHTTASRSSGPPSTGGQAAVSIIAIPHSKGGSEIHTSRSRHRTPDPVLSSARRLRRMSASHEAARWGISAWCYFRHTALDHERSFSAAGSTRLCR